MRTICYYPELVRITGSINAALMMAQLEFWFKIMGGKPFYKFLEPCTHELYKVGDSWSEELGMTSSEIRSAFKRIGTMYKSKSAFIEAMESEDVFKGKAYAAYYDRIRKTTYYLRNEDKVWEMLPQELSLACSTKRDGSARQESTPKRDGSGQQETTSKRDGSAHQDIYPAREDMENSSHTLSINEEIQDGLYIEDSRDNIIDNNIKESQEESHRLIPFEEIVCLYNDYLGEKLGYTRQLTHEDKVSIKKLWCHFYIQLEDFKKAFIKVAGSRFLCGKVEGKKWRASFKWLLAKDHLIKVLEGIYDDFTVSLPSPSKQTTLEKIKQFNQIDSHYFDFDEIERLERQYIDRKLESCIGEYNL